MNRHRWCSDAPRPGRRIFQRRFDGPQKPRRGDCFPFRFDSSKGSLNLREFLWPQEAVVRNWAMRWGRRTGLPNMALQTDERPAAVGLNRMVMIAPLAAERRVVSRRRLPRDGA
jgi:hypothetical protein